MIWCKPYLLYVLLCSLTLLCHKDTVKKKDSSYVRLDNDDIQHTDVSSKYLFSIKFLDVVCMPVSLTVGP